MVDQSEVDVDLVVFQELTSSYIDSLHGRAAPGGGGGGARHLPVPVSLDDVMTTRVFPEERMEFRKRKGKEIELPVYYGDLHYIDASGKSASIEATLEAPRSNRTERIISQAGQKPCLAPQLLPPESQGVPFLLFVVTAEDAAWPYYVSEQSLRDDDWDPRIPSAILGCLDETRDHRNRAQGYIDFTAGRTTRLGHE